MPSISLHMSPRVTVSSLDVSPELHGHVCTGSPLPGCPGGASSGRSGSSPRTHTHRLHFASRLHCRGGGQLLPTEKVRDMLRVLGSRKTVHGDRAREGILGSSLRASPVGGDWAEEKLTVTQGPQSPPDPVRVPGAGVARPSTLLQTGARAASWFFCVTCHWEWAASDTVSR